MRILIGAATALTLVVGFIACTDDTGTTIQPPYEGRGPVVVPPPPDAGDSDATTANDGGGDGGTQLSERAAKGVAISPFALTAVAAADLEKVGIGSYMVNAAGGCNDCHAQALPNGPPKYLGGGTAYPIGQGLVVYARNLTSDPTTGMKLTEDEFITAMRTGRDYRTGVGDASAAQSLLVMPWAAFRWMSLEDLKSIYAYLKLVPPVSNATVADIKPPVPPTPFPANYDEGERDGGTPLPAENAGGALNVVRGAALQPLADPPGYATFTQAEKDSFGRGAYLVSSVASCDDCHTNPRRAPSLKLTTASYLSGGQVFDVPPPLQPLTHLRRTMSKNLTGATHGFGGTFAQFDELITKGRPIGDGGTYAPLGWPMPSVFKDLVPADRQAIYDYMTKVPRRTGTADKVIQRSASYCTSDADCVVGTGATCNLGVDGGAAGTNECIHLACTTDDQCPACQTCDGTKCLAPAANSTCPLNGR